MLLTDLYCIVGAVAELRTAQDKLISSEKLLN
jgi:hypothetical protein